MKKVALVFLLAVILPSLVLAWLAVRSLRDQQFLIERQQSLLDQRVTDTLAQNISDYLAQRQQEFSAHVENLAANKNADEVAAQFDNQIRQNWPLAEVGFCVTLSGKILSPSPNARPESQMFYLDNKDFLGNREVVEVYRNQSFASANGNAFTSAAANQQSFGNSFGGGGGFAGQSQLQTQSQLTFALAPPAVGLPSQYKMEVDGAVKKLPQEKLNLDQPPVTTASGMVGGLSKVDSRFANTSSAVTSDSLAFDMPPQKSFNYKQQARAVSPQSVAYGALKDSTDEAQQNLSKVIPAEAEFAQLIGNQTDGMLARFLQNKLNLMFWHRLSAQPDLIFGAKLNLNRVVDGLRGLMQPDPALQNEICLAILDDNAKPVAFSRSKFQANWKHPFVATEIGDALPHWEVAAYLADPAALTRAACIANITIGLLIAVLVLAIVIGSWLIVRNLNSELTLARQKTDFVSNVSHELKTPLTSIRMFSELLAEGRVNDIAKQKSYLQIITAEAARLTRLINNVLDFSRMESGEKKYIFQPCDLTNIVRSTVETFRPHLEANAFKFDCELPPTPIFIRGDADALSQIIVNLLSNAEKYSNGGKEIILQLAQKQSPLPHAEVKVLDRGSGVPRGSEEKVFEKFYRAHDSLSSGVQGSGLGLTIARQIGRAHGGDVVCETRDGGGSCFVLRIPLIREPA
jgi:signal transduction histidine kinase